MSQTISPNRSELLKTKTKIAMAKRGHNLLKKKRDGLIINFFELLENAKDLRSELAQLTGKAQASLKKTRILTYDLELKVFAKSAAGRNLVDFQTKNVMGLSIPQIKSAFKTRLLSEREKSLYTSSATDETMQYYEEVVKKIIIIAEIETAMVRLLKEIEKTKRRVNGLEFKIMPELAEAEKFIRLSLEEQERDNLIVLKRVKAKS